MALFFKGIGNISVGRISTYKDFDSIVLYRKRYNSPSVYQLGFSRERQLIAHQ
jgi:hypothetical protein